MSYICKAFNTKLRKQRSLSQFNSSHLKLLKSLRNLFFNGKHLLELNFKLHLKLSHKL